MDNYIFDNRLRFNRDGVLCVNGEFYAHDVVSPNKASRMSYTDGDMVRLLTFNEHTVFSSIYAHVMGHKDDDGIHCCASAYEDIANENGVSVRTVQRVVNKLEKMGLIVKSKKFYGQTLFYIPYHKNIPNLNEIEDNNIPLFVPAKVTNAKYARVKLRKTSTKSKRRNKISSKLRFAALSRDDFTCQYCGRKAPDVVLHVDHIVPVAKGGTDDMDNLITACRDCNLGKSDTEI